MIYASIKNLMKYLAEENRIFRVYLQEDKLVFEISGSVLASSTLEPSRVQQVYFKRGEVLDYFIEMQKLTTEVAELQQLTAHLQKDEATQIMLNQTLIDEIELRSKSEKLWVKQFNDLKTVVKEYARHKKVECHCNPCVCGLDQALKGIL